MIFLSIPILSQDPIPNDPPNDKEDFEYQVNISFDFDDLNEEEILKAKGWIEELELEYASLIKTINFTKNQSQLGGDNIIGVNAGGNIIILYTGSDRDKIVIFHEILHEIVDLPSSSEEWFVDDLELCMSAYKN